MKIIILGAGVIGVTTAYFLSRAGHEVVVIDKAAGAGLSATFANGGQLSYAYSDSLANPAMLPKLPGLFLGFEPAFDIKLSADPALLSWGWRFLRNCTKTRAAFNTKNILRLALYSRLKLHQILAHQTIRFNYQQNGKLLIYININKKDFLRAAKQTEIKNQWGCQQQVLTQAECLAKEPALKSIANDIVGGIFSPLDESGDAYLFTTALAKLCAASGKVQFFYNTEIKELVVDKGRISQVKTADNHYSADAFVMCLGAESPLLCRTIGLKLPIYPLKGYSITVPATPAAPSINITDVHHKIVYSTLGDNLRIAGMLEMCGYDASLDEAKWKKRILQAALVSFPAAGDYRQITPWTGFRAGTPDSAPLLGRTCYSNFYLNTGHGMLGWTLACGSAAVVSDIINNSEPAIELTGLTLEERF